MSRNDDRPWTDAERLSAELLLAVADARAADARLALDLVQTFLSSLQLQPDQRLSDGDREPEPTRH